MGDALTNTSPQWLKNAIDLALLTASRRGDILEMPSIKWKAAASTRLQLKMRAQLASQ